MTPSGSGGTGRLGWIAAGALGLLALVLGVLFVGRTVLLPSHLASNPPMSALPGDANESEVLRKLAEDRARQEAADAEKQRKSYMERLDAAERSRKEQVSPPAAPAPAQPTPQPETHLGRFVNTMGPAQQPAQRQQQDQNNPWARSVAAFVGAMDSRPVAFAAGFTPEMLARREASEGTGGLSGGGEGLRPAAGDGRAAIPASGAPPSRPASRLVMPAFRWSPGRLVTANKTDSGNGLVFADITAGPLAGNRLMGEMQPGADRVTVTMNQLAGPSTGGQPIPVKAVLLAPGTMEIPIASSVDHHYPSRILLPTIAGAVQGVGQALFFSGSASSVTPYGGTTFLKSFSGPEIAGIAAGQGATAAQQALREMAPRNSTVNLDAGAPVGVMFLEPVYLP
ncbi:MAG: DotG/IcmE/VirB10 family protein [Solirubrobacterales bacterium]|nr:DotG/IcmE/VirB10 family protein [Solirubrobacterales bacterium]